MRAWCLALWGLVGLAAVGASRAEDAPAKPKVHTVASGPFEANLTFDGWAQNSEFAEIVLQPEEWATFTVDNCLEAGRDVKAGDVVISFETKGIDREIQDLKQQIAAGELGLKLARIDLELLDKSMPFELEAAERNAVVSKEEWEFYQKLGEALEKQSVEEQLKAVKEMLEGSQEELTQLEKMYKADDLTEETEEIILKRARREVDRGQFLLKQSQVHHDRQVAEELPRTKRQKEINKDRDAQNLEKARVALPLTVAQKKVELEKLEHTQKQLTEKLARIQKDRELMTIKAPIAGRMMYGQAERGRWVTADAMKNSLRRGGTVTAHQVFCTIVAPSAVVLHIDIPEKDRGSLQTGLKGLVFPTAYPHVSIRCELKQIASAFVKEATFGGIVTGLPMADGSAAPAMTGMTAKVRLVVFSENDVIAVPTSTVFADEDQPEQKYVWLAVTDGEPKKLPVEVGLASATRTHIKSGLKAGDQILLTKPEEK
jgi:HlyD family secretion protein